MRRTPSRASASGECVVGHDVDRTLDALYQQVRVRGVGAAGDELIGAHDEEMVEVSSTVAWRPSQ
jgi:hypothetical protein